jgi:hypothetical protein
MQNDFTEIIVLYDTFMSQFKNTIFGLLSREFRTLLITHESFINTVVGESHCIKIPNMYYSDFLLESENIELLTYLYQIFVRTIINSDTIFSQFSYEYTTSLIPIENFANVIHIGRFVKEVSEYFYTETNKIFCNDLCIHSETLIKLCIASKSNFINNESIGITNVYISSCNIRKMFERLIDSTWTNDTYFTKLFDEFYVNNINSFDDFKSQLELGSIESTASWCHMFELVNKVGSLYLAVKESILKEYLKQTLKTNYDYLFAESHENVCSGLLNDIRLVSDSAQVNPIAGQLYSVCKNTYDEDWYKPSSQSELTPVTQIWNMLMDVHHVNKKMNIKLIFFDAGVHRLNDLEYIVPGVNPSNYDLCWEFFKMLETCVSDEHKENFKLLLSQALVCDDIKQEDNIAMEMQEMTISDESNLEFYQEQIN